jgi:hypothetical protein
MTWGTAAVISIGICGLAVAAIFIISERYEERAYKEKQKRAYNRHI